MLGFSGASRRPGRSGEYYLTLSDIKVHSRNPMRVFPHASAEVFLTRTMSMIRCATHCPTRATKLELPHQRHYQCAIR
jgi:hypothetical protein